MAFFASIYAKLIAGGIVLLLLGLGGWYLHHQIFESGVTAGKKTVQTKFDDFKSKIASNAAAAAQKAVTVEASQRADFDILAANYEASAHASFPSVADSVSADLSAGNLRLRDAAAPVCPSSSGVSAATAASRSADAAATAALAQRTADEIAAIRVSDASDKREILLDAQVTALQAALAAERKP